MEHIVGVGCASLQGGTMCRRQGMRVGFHFAQALDSEKPLFDDEDVSLLPEEHWHADCAGSEFGIPSKPYPTPDECQEQPAIADSRRDLHGEPGLPRQDFVSATLGQEPHDEVAHKVDLFLGFGNTCCRCLVAG